MIVLGRIAAPFGVRGWVHVHPFGDDPVAWRRMKTWWLGVNPDARDEAAWTAYSLDDCKPHGKGLVASFMGVTDRSGAEKLEGLYLAAPREAWPNTEPDEYYWADLIGLTVLNEQEVRLGVVTGLVETGVHAVLQLADGEAERLIPFVSAYVKDVDLKAGCIRVEWGADW